MSKSIFSLKDAVGQTIRFVSFVASEFPGFYGLLLLSFITLGIEYIATSLMIPLASAGQNESSVSRFWAEFAYKLELDASPRIWLWLFFLFMGMRLILGYIQALASTALGKSVHSLLSNRVFNYVVAEEYLGLIHSRSIGYYITLAGDDTSRCGAMISGLIQIAMGLLTACIAMFVLYQFSPTYFLGVVMFLIACLICIALTLRYLVQLTVISNQLSRELNTAFVETINSLRSIRALSGEALATIRYADQIRRYVRQLSNIEALKSGIRIFPVIVLLLSLAFLMRPSADTMLGKEINLFAATVIVMRIFVALGQVVAPSLQLLTDLRALHDIDAVINIAEATKVLEGSDKKVVEKSVKSFKLHDIHFSYPGRHPIFEGANFEFYSGRTYAIIGPSGVGKSTLGDMILGLIRPESGSILINDIDCAPDLWRKKILLVEQQPRIFSTTLRDNLLFGVEASDADLWDVLELVGLAKSVIAMPEALDTILCYQGENFSGGQRQRIGIARALLRYPDVLVMDEATSALDQDSRELILRNVAQRMHGSILIHITHDLSISNRADKIYELGKT